MTSRVTASKAKTELLNLLTRVEAGETVTITRHGKPVAYLGPVSREQAHVHSAENDEPAPSGVLRPAPDAGIKAFASIGAGSCEKQAAEAAKMTPAGRKQAEAAADSAAHKKTAPAPVLDRSPVSAPKPLTLADILKSQGS